MNQAEDDQDNTIKTEKITNISKPVSFGPISKKVIFNLAKSKKDTRRCARHRVLVYENTSLPVLNDPNPFPSKNNPCICGSLRKYAKCCKKLVVKDLKKKNINSTNMKNLEKWRINQSLKTKIAEGSMIVRHGKINDSNKRKG